MNQSPIICKFKFACDKKWRDLNKIEGEQRVRHCGGCNELVYRCDSYESLSEHASLGHCVAINVSDEVDNFEPSKEMLGDLDILF